MILDDDVDDLVHAPARIGTVMLEAVGDPRDVDIAPDDEVVVGAEPHGFIHERVVVEVREAVDRRHEGCGVADDNPPRVCASRLVLAVALVAHDVRLLCSLWRSALAVDELAEDLAGHHAMKEAAEAIGQCRLARALRADDAESVVRGSHCRPPVRDHRPREDVLVARLSYVAILAFVLVGCLWLEVFLRTRVFARPRRLVLSILPVVVVFYAWDAYAVTHGHWRFDTGRILGLYGPWSVPLDEVLFFVTIPIASVLTFEAVRSVRGWPAGDETDDR